MSCVSCTLASCRARLARCGRGRGHRRPAPAVRRAQPLHRLPGSPAGSRRAPDGAQALADGNATPVRVTASPGLEAYLPASARRVPARRAARSMPESMSAGKRRSLSLATWPANNVEIHSAVAAVMVPSTRGLEGFGKAGELPMLARHRGDQQASVGRRPPPCNEGVPPPRHGAGLRWPGGPQGDGSIRTPARGFRPGCAAARKLQAPCATISQDRGRGTSTCPVCRRKTEAGCVS